ncbi:MAG: hypothetical protein WCL08_00155 [Verrucomicrobiota bacterium]
MSLGEFFAGATPEGELPQRRIADVSAAGGICMQLLQEDIIASQNRALIDGLIDGKPPYNQADLDEAGQSERVNVNTKDAAALEEQAVRAYYDLMASVERFITGECKYGDASSKPLFSTIIAEEITRTLREWNLFNLRLPNLQTQYVRHGVGMAFFEDEVNWQFRTTGLENFKMRRSTPACEDELDVLLIQAPYTVTGLYGFIKDAETATDNGWNTESVRKLVLQNVNEVLTSHKQQVYQNWELLERQIKENDLYYGSGDYHLMLNHLLVKEFDGSITHIIIPQQGSATMEFLYENRCQFEDIHRAVTIFTYGVGDGTYHSIRGMGWKIFDQEQAYTRLWNTAMDGAMGNSVTMLQPSKGSNNTDLSKMALSFNGPFAILPGGYDVVNRTIPDSTKSVIPVLSELKNQIRNNTQSYQTSPSSDNAQNMPVKNYQAYLAQESALSDSALDLWYSPWGRLLKEIVRRMTCREYGEGDPGYKEVAALKKRLLARGVPMEAFHTFDNVKPVRATGAGSKAARLAAYDQAIIYAGSTDEEGRYNLMRDRNIILLGADQIDRYWKPALNKTGFNQDQKNAQFENAIAVQFMPSQVSSDDNHTIHCASHEGLIQGIMESLDQGGEPNPDDLSHNFKVLSVIVPHLQQHAQYLGQDQSRKQESAYYNKVVQNASAAAERCKSELTAVIQNQQKQQQADQARQQEAMQARLQELEAKQGNGDPASDAKLQKEIMTHQVKMTMQQQQFEQQQRFSEAENAQKLAFKDSDNAMKILAMSKTNPYQQDSTK